jgi:hypothetical protein
MAINFPYYFLILVKNAEARLRVFVSPKEFSESYTPEPPFQRGGEGRGGKRERRRGRGGGTGREEDS